MRQNCWPFLWAVVSLLVNGMTYGQVTLFCDNFCLSAQVTCTCTITGSLLQWVLIDGTSQIGQRILESNDLNDPTTLFATPGTDPNKTSEFDIVVTDTTSGTLTARMSFTTLATYEGYVIGCNGDSESSTRTINIPGSPLAVNNLTLDEFTFDSVMLTFTAPVNSPCIANYSITTNASAPQSTTDTMAMITNPGSDPQGATYFVRVSAVDLAGRTGPSTSLDCFMFSGPNAIMFSDDLDYAMQEEETCFAELQWMADSCLPPATHYQIIANSTNAAVTVNETVTTNTFTFQNVSYKETYSVTIIPSNTLAMGSTTATVFTIPANCTTTTTIGSTALDSSASPSEPPAVSSDLSAGAIVGIVIGILIAVGICIAVILVFAIIIVKRRKSEKITFSGTSTSSSSDNGLSKVELNTYQTPSENGKSEGNGKPAPRKPNRSAHRSKEVKADSADQYRPISNESSQAVYADLRHDQKKSAKPAPKSEEQVTYSDISHRPQPQYADLEMVRGGGKIPQKPEGVVYSGIRN